MLSTKHRQGRHTLFKADVTIPILKLTLGGGGSTRRDVVREYATLTDLSISFEVAQIPLVRPWFDPTFLESRAWRFGDQALEMTQLSDGGSPPTGQLIGYPTSVIFVRKVCVTSKEVRDSFTEIKQHAKAGGGITLGLFSLTPRSQVTTDSSTTTHEQTDAALVSEGVQVIGFRCHLLDKSPNPLPTIKAFV